MTNEEGQRIKENREAIEALERFVVDNDDLLALESRIGRFNIFDALGIARKEIRHSNFLAFILDPAESHGQGALFLTALLMDLLKSAAPELRPLSPIELDGADLRGVEIKREWRSIDLLIKCEDPKLMVVVENKVDSGEHSNQLARYKKTIGEQYPNEKPLYVFLTPEGDDASDETWLSYSYESVYEILKRVRDANRNAIGDEVMIFLDHYLNLLGTRFMNDEKLDELCKNIYKNHRVALDVIMKRVGNVDSPTFRELVSMLQVDARYYVLDDGSQSVDFVPKSWREWLPERGPDGGYSFCIHFRLREENIRHTMFVGPMKDAELRSRILSTLREECPKFGFKKTQSKKMTGERLRVISGQVFVPRQPLDDQDSDEIRKALKPKLDKLHSKLEELAPIFRQLCEPANGRVNQERD